MQEVLFSVAGTVFVMVYVWLTFFRTEPKWRNGQLMVLALVVVFDFLGTVYLVGTVVLLILVYRLLTSK